MPDLFRFRTAPRRRAALAIPCCLWLVLILSCATQKVEDGPSAPQIPQLPSIQLGELSLGLVAGPEQTPPGPFASSRTGDYVLQNDHVALFFCDVGPARPPGKSLEDQRTGAFRHPGALIDLRIGDASVDFLGRFQQGIGIDDASSSITYRHVEFLDASDTDQQALAIRFVGDHQGAGGNSEIETTYRLAAGETFATVESRYLSGDRSVPIADHADWGPGVVLAEDLGPAPGNTGAFAESRWYAARGGGTAIGIAGDGARTRGYFRTNQTRVQGPESTDSDSIYRRRIFFGTGRFSEVTDQIFAHPSMNTPTGTFTGTIIDEVSRPVATGWVNVIAYDQDDASRGRWLITQIRTDADGRFSAVLPEGRYFVGSASQSRRVSIGQRGIVIEPGKAVEREVKTRPTSVLKVRVIDSETKQPLAARVRFAAIAPTQAFRIDSVNSPAGYVDSFYVPPQGGSLEMPAGKWDLRVTKGIRYDLERMTAETSAGEETSLTVILKKSSPTPGWLGLEVGAMTLATPGSALSAEDILLMAAGEGLDWIVSGDWETITDFGPTIEQKGLSDVLGSSRGFRTRLPSRPELGNFLIYPVAADAPDPAQAREQWANFDTPSEFLATLRELYPGALIECITPYSDHHGYFYIPDKNPYTMAYHTREDIDPSIDAINVLPPRDIYEFGFQKDFVFVSALRNRFHIPAPVSRTRVPLLSEPGYPRLLVRTGSSNPTKVAEDELFAAMKAGRWQITSGPFIDFEVEGRREGDRFESPDRLKGQVRVTAPNWADTSILDLCKEGMMSRRDGTDGAIYGTSVRYNRRVDLRLYPQYKNDSDTLVNVVVQGSNTSDDALPTYGGPGVPSIAFTGPIVADTNANGQWDPPIYRDKGK